MRSGIIRKFLVLFMFLSCAFLLIGCGDNSPKQFHITFQYENGTVLEEKDVLKGSQITYTGETPTKSSTDTHTYEFVGWDHELGTATKDDTFVAQFQEKAIKYEIVFKNYDGTVLATYEVNAKTVPTYSGETPVKPSSATEDYTFVGWDKEVVAATANATYTATFSSSAIQYTVTFVNHNDEVLYTAVVNAGEAPVYQGEAPTKAETNMYTYTFTGWDKEVVVAVAATTSLSQPTNV